MSLIESTHVYDPGILAWGNPVVQDGISETTTGSEMYASTQQNVAVEDSALTVSEFPSELLTLDYMGVYLGVPVVTDNTDTSLATAEAGAVVIEDILPGETEDPIEAGAVIIEEILPGETEDPLVYAGTEGEEGEAGEASGTSAATPGNEAAAVGQTTDVPAIVEEGPSLSDALALFQGIRENPAQLRTLTDTQKDLLRSALPQMDSALFLDTPAEEAFVMQYREVSRQLETLNFADRQQVLPQIQQTIQGLTSLEHRINAFITINRTLREQTSDPALREQLDKEFEALTNNGVIDDLRPVLRRQREILEQFVNATSEATWNGAKATLNNYLDEMRRRGESRQSLYTSAIDGSGRDTVITLLEERKIMGQVVTSLEGGVYHGQPVQGVETPPHLQPAPPPVRPEKPVIPNDSSFMWQNALSLLLFNQLQADPNQFRERFDALSETQKQSVISLLSNSNLPSHLMARNELEAAWLRNNQLLQLFDINPSDRNGQAAQQLISSLENEVNRLSTLLNRSNQAVTINRDLRSRTTDENLRNELDLEISILTFRPNPQDSELIPGVRETVEEQIRLLQRVIAASRNGTETEWNAALTDLSQYLIRIRNAATSNRINLLLFLQSSPTSKNTFEPLVEGRMRGRKWINQVIAGLSEGTYRGQTLD